MFVNDKLPFEINIPLIIPPFHCSRCEAGTQASKKIIYSQLVVATPPALPGDSSRFDLFVIGFLVEFEAPTHVKGRESLFVWKGTPHEMQDVWNA